MTNVVGTDTHFSVTRRLALEDVDADGNTNVLTTNFVVKLEFPACTNFAGGDGTEATPWQIDNAPRLQLVSYLVSNDNTNYGSDHYDITAANIDMGTPGLPFSEMGSRTPDEMETAGKGFVPIGTIFNAFSGTFDCLSNTISGLYINRPMGGVGLMGQISGATIKNCGLTDVKIVGNFETGGLVGGSANATISASYVTGAVTSSSNVGGLVGDLKGSEINSNSYAIVTVTGMSTNVGGLVGQMSLRSKITDSYAAGNIIGMDSNVGGLVGGMVFVPVGSFKFTSDVTNSYATGNVTGMGANVGGLVGGVKILPSVLPMRQVM
ncbi:hypothetical protein COTS27_00245 [Spirochaetota bacterium]|nr:hypothetical protein COTS27_00245 [Spirochaetota bacterium]